MRADVAVLVTAKRAISAAAVTFQGFISRRLTGKIMKLPRCAKAGYPRLSVFWPRRRSDRFPWSLAVSAYLNRPRIDARCNSLFRKRPLRDVTRHRQYACINFLRGTNRRETSRDRVAMDRFLLFWMTGAFWNRQRWSGQMMFPCLQVSTKRQLANCFYNYLSAFQRITARFVIFESLLGRKNAAQNLSFFSIPEKYWWTL